MEQQQQQHTGDSLALLVARKRDAMQFEWTTYTRGFFLSYGGRHVPDQRCTNWRWLFVRLARRLRRKRGTSKL